MPYTPVIVVSLKFRGRLWTSPLLVLRLLALRFLFPENKRHAVIITKHIVKKLCSPAFPAKVRHTITSMLSGTRNMEVIVARMWFGTNSALATAIAGHY